MKIAVFGANGQVGSAIVEMAEGELFPLTRADVDLADADAVSKKLEDIEPDVIFNAAAYTQVDKAEEEEELATRINADAPEAMAVYALAKSIPFVHFSTDYVFPGHGRKPWREVDQPGPLSAYGRSKLAGDRKIMDVGGDYLIFRTSWVYDADGKNFFTTMLKFGAEKEALSIVNDQFGAPSHAPDLAHASLMAVEKGMAMKRFPSGIYNLCNSGVATWYEFAEAIFEEAREQGTELKVQNVTPITTAEFPRPAKRPMNSRLDMTKLQKTFKIYMPEWESALHHCMHALSGTKCGHDHEHEHEHSH